MSAAMSAEKITPRPAFRLLTWVLFIFALADLLPATGLWRMAASGFAALMLAGLVAGWIGLVRVPGRAAIRSHPARPISTPFKLARPSVTRGGRIPLGDSTSGPYASWPTRSNLS